MVALKSSGLRQIDDIDHLLLAALKLRTSSGHWPLSLCLCMGASGTPCHEASAIMAAALSPMFTYVEPRRASRHRGKPGLTPAAIAKAIQEIIKI